jgi:hypothetical protein
MEHNPPRYRYYCKLHGMSDTNFCLGCTQAEIMQDAIHYVTHAGLEVVNDETDDLTDPDHVTNSDVYSEIMYLERQLQ